MSSNYGFSAYNAGIYTHIDQAYNDGTSMNSEPNQPRATSSSQYQLTHSQSTSSVGLQQDQFQGAMEYPVVLQQQLQPLQQPQQQQPQFSQPNFYGQSTQQFMGSSQLHPSSNLPISTDTLTNSFAAVHLLGVGHANPYPSPEVIAQSLPMSRSYTSQSSNISIPPANGFGFDTTTQETFGIYGGFNQGGYPMQPSSSTSSELPQDAQAANVLTQLAQAQPGNLFAIDVCNQHPACIQPCDPRLIYDCVTFETIPCYNTACPPRCEVDGVDMTCERPHSFVDAAVPIFTTSNQGPESRPASIPQEPFSGSFSSDESNRLWQPCFHAEHLYTGCVNPLDVIKRNDISLAIAPDCCCNDPEHKPDPEDVIQRRKDHGPRQKRKAMRRRTNSSQMQLPNILTAQEYQPSSAEHSRRSSLTFGMPSISPVSSVPSFQKLSPLPQPIQPIHICQWIESRTGEACAIGFDSTATLQAHIESDHILSIRANRYRGNKLEHRCHWSICEAAINGKPFRQVQHLKDHIRTHTLCKSNHILPTSPCQYSPHNLLRQALPLHPHHRRPPLQQRIRRPQSPRLPHPIPHQRKTIPLPRLQPLLLPPIQPG